MGPSAAARRFATRLRLSRRVKKALREVDASDVLTVVCLALLGTGVTVNLGIGAGLIAVGGLLVFVTPIGTALRIFVRGR